MEMVGAGPHRAVGRKSLDAGGVRPLLGPAGPRILGRMFVRYFMDLEIPFEAATEALASDPQSWLPGLAAATGEHGTRLLAEVGFGSTVRVRKRVEVEVGEAFRLTGKTIVPIRWSTGSEHSPLPEMEGDLEVAPFGPDVSQLSMSGRYRPPLGAVGRAIDRALLNRVAEATVRDFVRRVAAALEGGVAVPAGAATRMPPVVAPNPRPVGA